MILLERKKRCNIKILYCVLFLSFAICIFTALAINKDDLKKYGTIRIEEMNCQLQKKLGEKDEFGIIPLISLPGSGNT